MTARRNFTSRLIRLGNDKIGLDDTGLAMIHISVGMACMLVVDCVVFFAAFRYHTYRTLVVMMRNNVQRQHH